MHDDTQSILELNLKKDIIFMHTYASHSVFHCHFTWIYGLSFIYKVEWYAFCLMSFKYDGCVKDMLSEVNCK